jgi:hypothetical protein
MLSSLLASFRGRVAIQTEILALRHQLTVLQRTHTPRHLMLTRGDRCLWVWLSRLWSEWRSALIIVKPETVVGWHRQGFRLYWTWKVRHGRSGRPQISKKTRDVIRKISCENPLWGAPRIHSELLKLGIEISQASVAKYMIRHRSRPPKLGGRSSTITFRNSLQSTSSPSIQCGLKFFSCSSSSRMIDAASSTST